ncbi:hypothetical protein SB748_13090 [Rhizobium sp. SIMBA_035]
MVVLVKIPGFACLEHDDRFTFLANRGAAVPSDYQHSRMPEDRVLRLGYGFGLRAADDGLPCLHGLAAVVEIEGEDAQ